jgi:hypothetical protein
VIPRPADMGAFRCVVRAHTEGRTADARVSPAYGGAHEGQYEVALGQVMPIPGVPADTDPASLEETAVLIPST